MLKQLEQLQQKKSNYKTIFYPKPRRIARTIFLSPICRCNQWQKYIIHFLLAFGYSRWLVVGRGVYF